MTSFYKKTQAAFWLLFVGLLGIFIYNKLVMPEQVEKIQWILLAFQTVPLLLFVPFLLKPTSRTFQWFCFMLLLYFLIAVLNIFYPGMYYIGLAESIVVGLLFTASMMLGRWKMRGMDTESN
ncbi:DUF2069 domain-containing protein [Litoribrevibacter euphylliae]|uniref:DUF2069 domain-containing protein n=1 Tax=Litoribrevibacter euphylliae TaxID=1834034 RepID=A0ABV7HFT9_9GAMM